MCSLSHTPGSSDTKAVQRKKKLAFVMVALIKHWLPLCLCFIVMFPGLTFSVINMVVKEGNFWKCEEMWNSILGFCGVLFLFWGFWLGFGVSFCYFKLLTLCLHSYSDPALHCVQFLTASWIQKMLNGKMFFYHSVPWSRKKKKKKKKVHISSKIGNVIQGKSSHQALL